MPRGRRRRRGGGALFFGVLLLAAFFLAGPLTGGGTSGFSSLESPLALGDERTDFSGRVTRIVDGDTFHVEGAPASIRIWGLDAPERNETGFAEATEALRRIAGGRIVRCRTIDHDRYGRIVARCHLPSGDDVTALMIRSGTAGEYTHFSKGYYLLRGVRSAR